MNASETPLVNVHFIGLDHRLPLLPLAIPLLMQSNERAPFHANSAIYAHMNASLRKRCALTAVMDQSDLLIFPHDALVHAQAARTASETAKRMEIPALFLSDSDIVAPSSLPSGVIFRTSILASKRRLHEFIATGGVPDLHGERQSGHSVITPWTDVPSLGFIGHVASGLRSLPYIRNGWQNFYGFRLREHVLRSFEGSQEVQARFVRRGKNLGPPMAGVDVDLARNHMRREYVNSVFECDYALCMRGAGNWSYRFFEALSAGRIPVMIDTDCMLPLEDEIDWSRHICRIPYAQIASAPVILREFHHNLGPDGFATMQKANRNLWVQQLEPGAFFLRVIERLAQGRSTTNP
jgi:hypothetical protein